MKRRMKYSNYNDEIGADLLIIVGVIAILALIIDKAIN